MEGSKETKIVLLGRTGSGKSSVGNLILGDSLLKTKNSPKSETSECQAESKTINGRRITVIDTPGFFDTNMDEERMKPEILKSIKEFLPGCHAFLIVLTVGRYTEQERDVIKKILEYFSEEALKHAVVVFTHGDQLSEGETIEKFVRKNKGLSDLVKKCGGRCHVVDNKYWNNDQQDDYRNNKFQVTQLLNTIETMKNEQGIYSNEFLKTVEKDESGDIWTILAGATVGALLGAIFGGIVAAITLGSCIMAVAGSCIGGAAGGFVGAAIGCKSKTPQEAVEKTTKTMCEIVKTANEIIKSAAKNKDELIKSATKNKDERIKSATKNKDE